MLKRDIDHLLQSESETVEWKRSLGEWKEIVITSAAMASLHGGHIIIGVDPGGDICGVQVGRSTTEDLANKIVQNTSPRVTPSITHPEYRDKFIVIVSVPESTSKPVYAFDRPYRRSGRTNQRLSQEETLHLYMTTRGITWDQSIVTGASVDVDIDPAMVRRFLMVARTERRWEVPEATPVNQVLRQMGLIQDGSLTAAAILLFGRNPQRLLTQAMVRCARFKGTREVHFLDMKVIEGNIIDQVEEAMAFIRRNIRMGAEIRGLRREEKWEYPLEGLREAILNAICHRDYASSANVQIRIFDDRLEIWNPGKLPEGMTVEDLRAPHESKPWNKLVANVFFLIKYIEQFGTGIQRILDDCRAQGLPEPTFEAQGHSLRVVFRPGEFKGAQLNDRQTKAVLHVQQQGYITRSQYETELGVSGRTANRDLNDLVTKGIFSLRGTGPKSRYVLSGDEPKDGDV